MANTFEWVEIRTNHIEETANFYERLFGWKIIEKDTADGCDVWIFDTSDEPRTQNIRRGGIWLRPQGESLGVVVYIVVDNIDSTLKRVVELGGKIVTPKHHKDLILELASLIPAVTCLDCGRKKIFK